jgi:hypothetical protein
MGSIAGLSVKDADLVTFITFTAIHISRLEDFPVMPGEVVGAFSKRNPALDVPEEIDSESVHMTTYTDEQILGTGTGYVRPLDR